MRQRVLRHETPPRLAARRRGDAVAVDATANVLHLGDALVRGGVARRRVAVPAGLVHEKTGLGHADDADPREARLDVVEVQVHCEPAGAAAVDYEEFGLAQPHLDQRVEHGVEHAPTAKVDGSPPFPRGGYGRAEVAGETGTVAVAHVDLRVVVKVGIDCGVRGEDAVGAAVVAREDTVHVRRVRLRGAEWSVGAAEAVLHARAPAPALQVHRPPPRVPSLDVIAGRGAVQAHRAAADGTAEDRCRPAER